MGGASCPLCGVWDIRSPRNAKQLEQEWAPAPRSDLASGWIVRCVIFTLTECIHPLCVAKPVLSTTCPGMGWIDFNIVCVCWSVKDRVTGPPGGSANTGGATTATKTQR